MRKKVGTFRYPIEIGDAGGERFEAINPVVDTGALYTQVPGSILQRLGHRPNATRRFRLADGSTMERPVGTIPVRLDGEVQSVLCIFGEEGCEMLLGATTLETFSVTPDPVNETLVPTTALLLSVDSVEETAELTLDFDKTSRVAQVPGVIPCAVQHADTGEVILIAYVNQQALQASIESRSAVFWSTSRNELWEKGKTSGETFELIEVRVNCEQNSLLYRVRPRRGGICHTNNAAGQPRNCFYRRLDFETGSLVNLDP